jgi:hypothetical protein
MLEAVSLIGEHQKFGRNGLVAQVIVGMECPDGNTLLMRNGDPRYPEPHKRTPKRSSIPLSSRSADRLREVFTRLFVDGEQLDYDCNSFPPYVLGEVDEFCRGPFTTDFVKTGPVNPTELEAGHPYIIIDNAGDIAHTMIAANTHSSLSLIGASVKGGGLMMMAANIRLMKVYDGASVNEVTRQGVRFGANF